MTQQVRQDMARMEAIALSRGQNPNDSETRCAIFCNAIIHLGFAYAGGFYPGEATLESKHRLYNDANNIFLVGLLWTRRGSCVSMPVVYLVVGQRLGFPVYLVAVGDHYFIRWDEPGYRLNIEPTKIDKVWVTDDDTAYLEELGLTRDQLKGSDLRNLTKREVVGNLFFAREGYWAAKRGTHETQRCVDLSRARHLTPSDPAVKAAHEAVFNFYGIKPEQTALDIRPKKKV